jgi:hypothetical protein
MDSKIGMVERASIDLHFAQAEITRLGSRDSLLRALDHVRQAEASLMVATKEWDAAPEKEAKASHALT